MAIVVFPCPLIWSWNSATRRVALLTTNTSSSLHSSRTNYRLITSTLFGISNYIFVWILLLHGTTAPSIRSVEQSGFPLVLCGRLSVSLDSLSAMATIFGEKQTLHGPLKFRTLIEPAIRCILCTPPANVKYTNPPNSFINSSSSS